MSFPHALPVFTPKEYLSLERFSEIRHEYLDGFVYAMVGESPDHSTICFNLATVIGSQLRGSPCRGFSPNMKVRTGEKGLYAYPDLAVVCGEPVFHDENHDVLVNPTAIFEVLSPSTEAHDRGEKFLRYHTQIDTLLMCWSHKINLASSTSHACLTAHGYIRKSAGRKASSHFIQ